ncbi:hypothetical protein [Crocosphaera sp. Alani8]|uniref:hypothetical protein n=1 Tax=Crocosphaera sp. Alani8 TaxID=3038952 RepID=UPI00313DA193
MKLILHPGHGKCGSSSIQNFLYGNINKLEEKGAYLPDKDFYFSFEKNNILQNRKTPVLYFKKLIDDDNIIAFERRLGEVLVKARETNCRKILISAENLGNMRGISEGRKIHEILASYFEQVTVIFYLRRQDDYLVSSWQQWEHKKGLSLNEYIEESLDLYRPDFLKIIRFFEEIYDKNSLIVVPLSKKKFKNNNLIADFCERTQLDIINNYPQIQSNQSLNPYLCDVLRRTPSIYQDVHDLSIKKLLTKYIDSTDFIFYNDKTILDQQERIKILKRFENDNKIIHHQYFNDLPYDDFVGLPLPKNNTSDHLEDDMERLKNIVAIQMEIIIKLLKDRDKEQIQKKQNSNLRRKLTQNVKKITRKVIEKFT